MKQRQALIGASVGAALVASSSAIAVFTAKSRQKIDPQGYLYLAETRPSPPGENASKAEWDAIKERMQPGYGAKIIMGCKVNAADFVSMGYVTESPPDYWQIRLEDVNADQINCIMEMAKADMLEFSFEDVSGVVKL